MLFEWLPLVLGAVVMVAVGVAMSRFQRNQQMKREEGLLSEARSRGWTFDAADEGVFRLMRWRGVTEGVTWTAEYRRRKRKKNAQHVRTHRVTWWADTLRGPAEPILFLGLPKGRKTPDRPLAQGEGTLARLAVKAAGFALDQAVDVYFGEDAGRQVDAATLRPVETGTPPGFVVMSTDPAGASRLLAERWTEALSIQTRDTHSALSDDADRPWVLLLPKRVSVASMRRISSAADIERLARAGVALVKRT